MRFARRARQMGIVAIAFCLPHFAILGAVRVASSGDNSVLLLVMVAMALLVILGVTSKRLVQAELFPLMVVAVALALLFHVSMISPYLYGFDIHLEYYLSRLTQDSHHWNPAIIDVSGGLAVQNYNAMMSVTVLPAALACLSKLPTESVFKIIYPALFSIVPLVLYRIYQERTNSMVAFLATFFFMSSYIFYNEMVGLGRQMIAELNLVLLVFVMLEKPTILRGRGALFMILSLALAFSHYGTSYFLILCFAIAWLLLAIFGKGEKKLTGTLTVFFFVVVLSWYLYVSSSAPLESAAKVAKRTIDSILTEMSYGQVSDPNVLMMLGMGEPAKSPAHLITRVLYYATQFFMVVGVFVTVRQKNETKFERDYVAISIGALVILVLGITLPYFAVSMNMSRFYHLALIFLAPFCILGMEATISTASRAFSLGQGINRSVDAERKRRVGRRSLLLIVVTLISYFLLNAGFVYEIIGDPPSSKSLSMNRMSRVYLSSTLTYGNEVFGARWLSSHMSKDSEVYGDLIAREHVLTSYGAISQDQLVWLSSDTKAIDSGSYIYLRTSNTLDGKMIGPRAYYSWDTEGISQLLEMRNRIYSDGGNTIYNEP